MRVGSEEAHDAPTTGEEHENDIKHEVGDEVARFHLKIFFILLIFLIINFFNYQINSIDQNYAKHQIRYETHHQKKIDQDDVS